MAKNTFSTHTGMVDVLPDTIYRWQHIEDLIRTLTAQYFFEEIRTPILEPTELIARGVGQLTDIVSKEMFAFARGEDQYVLRPEGTASVARAFIQHHLDQRGGTQQLYYIGPMFRAERPQKGRQRQFHQFGAEVLGTDDPLADAEVISLMVDFYSRLGITNTVLKLNSVGDPESRARYKTALQAYFAPHREQLSEVSQLRLEQNPMRILDSKEEQDIAIVEQAPKITDFLNEECADHFERVQSHLKRLEIPFKLDPTLVRGLDYYTKTAFELISPDLGGQDALAGGGRYDLLVGELGGKPTPAIGFACGLERALIVCEELGIEIGSTPKLDVYFITRGEAAQKWAMKTKRLLRNDGFSAMMDLSGKSLKAQMKDANRKQAQYAVIVGDDELNQQVVTLRNMDSSEETTLPMHSWTSQLKVKGTH